MWGERINVVTIMLSGLEGAHEQLVTPRIPWSRKKPAESRKK